MHEVFIAICLYSSPICDQDNNKIWIYDGVTPTATACMVRGAQDSVNWVTHSTYAKVYCRPQHATIPEERI